MPETLDVATFKHVVVPIGVVIGLGVARMISAVSQYIQHRDRVRFSLAHALWSAVLFLWFVALWWIAWSLRRVDADLWSYFTLIFLLLGPCLMYLAATLVLPKRVFQATAVSLFAIGVVFPSQRTATVLGAAVLPLAIVAFATVRAQLG